MRQSTGSRRPIVRRSFALSSAATGTTRDGPPAHTAARANFRQHHKLASETSLMKWSGVIDVTSHELEYLAAIARTGLYGSNVDEVVRSLILAGIREAA